MNHPFGSWSENSQGGSNVSPTFGALPYPSDPRCSCTSFYFSSFNPDIMNCVVVGPQAQQLYRVVTDKNMPGYTVIKKADGSNLSLIEWKSHPLLEIRGLLSKQPVGTWLGLSADKRLVVFACNGNNYWKFDILQLQSDDRQGYAIHLGTPRKVY